MDSMQAAFGEPTETRAIQFTGNWREYFPIAATNVLLILVTLGIYRFWAAARQRRYLWSRTHFIDDHLEWTGTGKEMFIGFLVVLAILLPFFLFIQFAFPALLARGMEWQAFGVFFIFYIALFYLGGFARFRALRYRLSRSWWHGIRGGSNDPGWAFAGQYTGRHALSAVTLFILFPWAATRLWNARWNAMSFGPLRFQADLTAEGLKRRWALVYLVPIIGFALAMFGLAGLFAASSGDEAALGSMLAPLIAVLVIFYIGIPLATLHWFAKFYRQAAQATSLGELEFGFDARTRDWLKLFLGNIGLAVITLGFGIAYWGYRNWSFMVRHMHIYGEVDLSRLTQSEARAPSEAEGFADAFDIGAI
jgi:uncharacterized membrane protein YjgN (DUF898 family)